MKWKSLFLVVFFMNRFFASLVPLGASPDVLFKAVKKGDKNTVRLQLNMLNSENEKFILEWQSRPLVRTALLQATVDRDLEIVRMLVAAGSNIFASDYTGTSPVSYVKDVSHRSVEMIKIFLTTPHITLQKKLEWELLRDLILDADNKTPFSADQMCTFVATLLGTRDLGKLHYNWLRALSAKRECKRMCLHYNKTLLPTYQGIAKLLLAHYQQQRKRIIKELVDTQKPKTYLSVLPLELRHHVINFYQAEDQAAQQGYAQSILNDYGD